MAGVLVAIVAVVASGLVPGSGSPGSSGAPPSAAASSAREAPASSPAGAASTIAPLVSPAAAPASPAAAGTLRVAAVDDNGALTTMDELGGSIVSYPVPGVRFEFPTWSPDGTRVAAVGSGPAEASIYVFTVPRDGEGGSADPVVIYHSPDHLPFYLYWTPDSRRVGFLAGEVDGISLRTAPADGSAPPDGNDAASIIRRGAPLYFDWEGADRLLLHIGTGSDAFVGEVGLDGTSVAPAVPGPGDFRAASQSRDGRYVAYVHAREAGSGEIVVASHDGTSRHSLPVFGPAAFVFDPTGDALASIASETPVSGALAFPVGPLRLMDPGSGGVRTLLDGLVVAFFWSPDGHTIAALRLARTSDPAAGTGAGRTVVADVPAIGAAATPSPGVALHVTFVDVASGTVRSDRAIQLSGDFVNRLLPYFDQYHLSHRVWAPDSTSILLPLAGAGGRTQLVVLEVDGSPGRPIADGVSGFWSP